MLLLTKPPLFFFFGTNLQTFGIGWNRAKRLHDEELGLTNEEGLFMTDREIRNYIRQCFEQSKGCSITHLRSEFHIGYNRAKKLIAQEQKKLTTALLEDEDDGYAFEADAAHEGRRSSSSSRKPTHHHKEEEEEEGDIFDEEEKEERERKRRRTFREKRKRSNRPTGMLAS